jgi:XTP/dITP diphosphohydrolase
MSQVVLASGNRGKLRELGALLADFGHTLVPQTELGVEDAIEDGLSFVENALIKARHAARITGLPALADDSGLTVDALGGAPGIHSARYAGTGQDDDNIDKLLNALAHTPAGQRQASFWCVLTLVRHANDPVPVLGFGRWSGQVAEQRCGTGGFGYDSVFWCPEHNCTAAELTPGQKNAISHRALAMAGLRPGLVEALG